MRAWQPRHAGFEQATGTVMEIWTNGSDLGPGIQLGRRSRPGALVESDGSSPAPAQPQASDHNQWSGDTGRGTRRLTLSAARRALKQRRRPTRMRQKVVPSGPCKHVNTRRFVETFLCCNVWHSRPCLSPTFLTYHRSGTQIHDCELTARWRSLDGQGVRGPTGFPVAPMAARRHPRVDVLQSCQPRSVAG